MSEIIAAIDEGAANDFLDIVVAGVGPQSASGSSSLGPFGASYSVTGTLTNGTVDLIPPDTIRVADLRLDWTASLTLSIDLGDFLPEIHIPQVCVTIPCVGKVCTPAIDITWPTLSVPLSFGDFVKATVDLGIVVGLAGGVWKVEGVVQGVPSLSFGPGTAAIVAAIGLAVAAAVAWVPFIGPFLAGLAIAVAAAIGVAGLTGWLGPIISPFISGTRFPVYDQPEWFEVLPSSGAADPAVYVHLDAIGAEVQHNAPEDELVLTADISA